MAYSAGSFSLEIEGQFAGYLPAAEGGEPVASVVLEPPDAGKVVRKHPGSVSYTPIQLSFGSTMEPAVYQWMADMLKGNQAARNGALVFYDYGMLEERRIEFTAALMTRLVFPGLDAASTDPALFQVTLQPQVTHVSVAKAGSKGPATNPPGKRRALLSNFKVTIGNLPTNRIRRVEPMVATQAVKRDGSAVALQPLDISNFAFLVSEADAVPMYAWFDDFILAGNGSKEQNGSINLLDTTLSAILFTLTLSNIGIVKVQSETQLGTTGLLKFARVEAYVEQLSLVVVPEAHPQRDPTPPVALETILQTLSVRGRTQSAGAAASATGGTKTLDPVLIAQRFKHPPATQVRSLHDAGVLIGTQWASETASLDEARQLADLASLDWDAVRLEQDHSLVATLVGEGLLETNHDGPIDLARDGFTEGVIVGASRVVQKVSPVRSVTSDALDSLSEMGEMESLRLQMSMDRISKLMSMMSNVLKKTSDTADSISQNIK